MHTLTDGVTTLELPVDMMWVDELAWCAAVSSVRRAVDGTLTINASARTSGRPITLVGSDTRGWIGRAVVVALRTMLSQPGVAMILTLDDGREFAVVSMPGQEPLEAEMVMPVSDPGVDEQYFATLRLMGV